MKQIYRCASICIAFFFILGSLAFGQSQGFSISPTLNNGKKWRIGYYQGGEYVDYQKVMKATIRGLMEMEWIKLQDIPDIPDMTNAKLLDWLSYSAKSQFLEFNKANFYSADWDKERRTEVRANLIKRLRENDGIDLMLAMGTWAGQDLSNNDHQVPTVVLSTSDPLSAGIIKSIEDSGYDHIHARVDPFRYERQIRIFQDIIGFQKLGVAYEDTVQGRSYAAIDKVEPVSKERGFEIIRCFLEKNITDVKITEDNVMECFNELVKKVDAIYVTQYMGVNKRSIPKLVEITNSNRIPTFSQSGSDEVRYGFLMSISTAGAKYVGQFHAETIAKIMNGANPRQLNQIFESPPKIAINLKTCETIGYDPPVDVLGAADEIYQTISVPE